MVDVTTGLSARETLTVLAERGVDPRDPEFQDALLALAQEAVVEEKAAKDAAKEAIVPALVALADSLQAVPEYRHVSKTRVNETTGKVSGGNAGYRVEWMALPDGRKIQVHVLDKKQS